MEKDDKIGCLHLSKTPIEANITELEFLFWRMHYSFVRWQEDCLKFVSNIDLSADDIALLHLIRMHERSKTIYDIARLMNRDDMSNIQYSLKKLIKLNFISKTNSNKTILYQVTDIGISITDKYIIIRRNLLLKSIKDIEKKNWDLLYDLLKDFKNIYDESSRLLSLETPGNL